MSRDTDLIYSVGEVFRNSSDQDDTKSILLREGNKYHYHIPIYQRGYKWKDDNVDKLLNDINDARSKEDEEYLLHYITIKADSSNSFIEVIDGQQRLTTLSVLFFVINKLDDTLSDITENKMHYAIRKNFFTNSQEQYSIHNIWRYIKNPSEEAKASWGDFIKENEDADKQDIYHLFHAVKKCKSFIDDLEEEQVKDFYDYLVDSVQLIVNLIENVDSAITFTNLNSNKVKLTDTELVKGVVITKVAHELVSDKDRAFKEMMAVRVRVGMQWEEVNKWVRKKEVRHFFFNNEDTDEAMSEALRLVCLLQEASEEEAKKNSLFDYFYKQKGLSDLFQVLITNKSILESWFEDEEIYNLMGFCRFSQSNNNSLEFLGKCIKQETKKALLAILENEKNKILQSDEDYEIEELSYGDSKLEPVLLSLSVFTQPYRKFDFYTYSKDKWSIEHIFPQSPDHKDYSIEDMKYMVDQLKQIDVSIKDLTEEDVDEKIRQDKYNGDPDVKPNGRERYEWILTQSSEINNIGNLCLLNSSHNSALSNLMFKDKRTKILEIIQKGEFVPKHTFNVFSKMIDGLRDSDLKIWDIADIKNHRASIKNKMTEILNNDI